MEGYVPLSIKVASANVPADVKRVLEILNHYKTLGFEKLKTTTAGGRSKKHRGGDNDKVLGKNEAIIFTGDLIDRGEQSLSLLKGMIDLKENNKERVCLCAGNRDMNKLRMYDEFAITKNGEELFTNKNEVSFIELAEAVAVGFDKTYKFKNSAKTLSPLLSNTLEPTWSKLKTDEWKNIFSEDLSTRVTNVYEKTLGAKDYPIKHFKTEIATIFPDLKNNTVENIYFAALAILNMVMGVKWEKQQLPEELEPFNGLYVDYLKNCHIIAAFKAGDNKYGIASHSGIPVDRDGIFTLTNPLGSKSKEDTTLKPTTEIMKSIDEQKNKVLEECNFDHNLRLMDTNFKRLILMSANVGDLSQLEINTIDSKRSPMASMSALSADGPLALAKSNKKFKVQVSKSGGSFTDFNDNHENGDNSENKYYNIFGHQPCGYCPQIAKLEEVNSKIYHVCMDISRAEGNDANMESFSVLTINADKSEDKVSGVIQEKNANFTYNHKLDVYCSFDYVEIINKEKTYIAYFNPLNFKKFIVQKLGDTQELQKTENKNLIITTGDTSDADGFISVALYAKTGASLLFIINIPYPYNPSNIGVPQSNIETTTGYKEASPIPTLLNSKTQFYDNHKNPYGLGYNYNRSSDEAEKHVKMCIHLVSKIWSENDALGKLNFLYKHNNQYFYNDINPFSGNTLSNDLEVYKYNTLNTLNNLDNLMSEYKNFDIDIKEYENIYMDMNGSCAFYNEGTKSIFNTMFQSEKFKGLYVMGGIDGLVMPDTMNFPFMNRIHIATMNQVYAPQKAGELMNVVIQAGKPIKFVSNNEVNANANYGDSVAKTLPYVLDNFGGKTLQKVMRDYYVEKKPKPGQIKLFDPMTSLVLIKDMLQSPQSPQPPQSPQSPQPVIKSCTFQNQYYFEKMLLNFAYLGVEELIIEKPTHVYYDMNYGTTILLEKELTSGEGYEPLETLFEETNKPTRIKENPYTVIRDKWLEDKIKALKALETAQGEFQIAKGESDVQAAINDGKLGKPLKLTYLNARAPAQGGKRTKSSSEYVKYKGRKYRVRVGKRGGKYIKVDDQKIYV